MSAPRAPDILMEFGQTYLHVVDVDVTVCTTCSQPSSTGTKSQSEQRFRVVCENLQTLSRHRIPDPRGRILGTCGNKFVFASFGSWTPLDLYEFCRVSSTHDASSGL